MAEPTPAPAPPVAPDAAPALGRALALLGVSVALTLLIFGWFYVNGSRSGRDAAMLWFSAWQSLGAVLLPTVIACYWPPGGAPGRLPAYARPSRDVVLGALFVSLPLYALSAAWLFATGAWDPGSVVTPTPGPQAPAPRAGAPSPAALAGLWLVFAALPAVAEELMYRGLIQPAIAHRWGAAWGIGVTAALFSFFHMEPAGLLPRMLMGVWFGWLAWRTRSLWASTWAHALNNTWGVLLLAGMGVVTGRPGWVAAVSLASLGAGVAFFWRAGWFRATTEEPSAATAVLRLKGGERS